MSDRPGDIDAEPRPAPEMWCIRCDHRLIASADQCPECGRGYHAADPTTWRDRPRIRRRVDTGALVVFTLLGGIATPALFVGTGFAFLSAFGLGWSWRASLLIISVAAAVSSSIAAAVLWRRGASDPVLRASAVGLVIAFVLAWLFGIAGPGASDSGGVTVLLTMALTAAATMTAIQVAYRGSRPVRRAFLAMIAASILIGAAGTVSHVSRSLAMEREIASIAEWAEAARDPSGRYPETLAEYPWRRAELGRPRGRSNRPALRWSSWEYDGGFGWEVDAFFPTGVHSVFTSNGRVFHRD